MPSQTDFQILQDEALAWAERAAAQGWLSSREVAQIASLENRSPEALFDGPSRRPLVVAFFGGTGVGKSTLLNRLADQAVARTGVVRPTSREISVYLHESVQIKPLPSHLPLNRVHRVFHRSEIYRDVLWVDMPDFDSTDRSNHELALQWLPHIDVLIYVVSPERYRDDRGWRILLQHERDHAWIFVINQWDRGDPAQLEDFERLLRQAGFDDPLVFRTDSRPDGQARQTDDFAALEELIRGFAEQRVMEYLTQHNLEGRFHHLTESIAALSSSLGDEPSFQRLRDTWVSLWADAAAKLRKGLQWPMDEFVTRFVNREADPLQRSLNLTDRTTTEQAPAAKGPLLTLIWDDWAQLSFEDTLDKLLLEGDELGLPSAVLRDAFQPLRNQASRWVLDSGQTALREALARPGNRGQRFLLKLAGLLAVVAPLGAIGWVAYEVVVTYYRSVQTQTLFLGTEFAIHSGLLILVSWLLPYFAHHKLKPSAEKTARRGLQRGLEDALDALQSAVSDRLSDVEIVGLTLRREAFQLVERSATVTRALPPSNVDSAPFRRTLASTKR